MQHILQGDKALCHFKGSRYLHDAGNLLKLRDCIGHQLVIFQGDHIAVAQVIRCQTAECCGLILMVCNKFLQGLFPGLEAGFIHIGKLIDLCADASGFRIGQAAVHIGHNLIGLVQILHHNVYIVNQGGEAAHDHKAGHRNQHSGKGHKTVEEDSPDALFH